MQRGGSAAAERHRERDSLGRVRQFDMLREAPDERQAEPGPWPTATVRESATMVAHRHRDRGGRCPGAQLDVTENTLGIGVCDRVRHRLRDREHHVVEIDLQVGGEASNLVARRPDALGRCGPALVNG